LGEISIPPAPTFPGTFQLGREALTRGYFLDSRIIHLGPPRETFLNSAEKAKGPFEKRAPRFFGKMVLGGL